MCQKMFNEQLQFPFEVAFNTMRQLIIAFLIIGVWGFVNSLPAPQLPVPGNTASTDKALNGPSTMTAKTGNEAPTVQTTPPGVSVSTKPSEHGKEATTAKSANEATSPPPNKNEPNTLKMDKDQKAETTTLKSKDLTPDSPANHKTDQKEPSSSQSGPKEEPKGPTTAPPTHKAEGTSTPGHKGEPTSPSTKKEQTTANPKSSNQKGTKTSTAYIDKGKVVIFNGICGPEGCEIEGDIYDELVPVKPVKKQ